MTQDPLTPEITATATAAGLTLAIAHFPADLAAAAAAAKAATTGLNPPEDPRAEPWPPMQPGHPA